jgi:hypothetical protein
MLYCVGSVALTERRGLFFLDAQQLVPGVRTTVLRLPPPDSLRFLVAEERVAAVLAKYAFDVLSIFNVVELYLHPALFGPEYLSP